MTDIQKTEEALSPSDKLTILYEDNHIIVVLKPQNLASCPDESGDENLLDLVREYIRMAYNKPGNVYVGLVHRLDRPTGGVMVFAKTSKAAGRLGEQMKTGDFEKKYLTVLNGCPHSEQGMVYLCTQGTDGAKLASLDYHILEKKEPLALCDITLHTGRSHQIRVQMAGIAHPVYGDMRYGGERAQKGKLALWAYSLSFTHPVTKERMRFLCEPPKNETPWNKFDLAKAMAVG